MEQRSRLFETVTVGGQQLRNRMVLPPLTRSRASDDGVPTALMAEYYRQRAGAGMVISEGTVITPQASAYARVPGIYSAEQVAGWLPVVEAAGRDGAVVYAQLWHVGRQSHSSVQPDGLPPKAPSAIPITGYQYRSAHGRIPYETPRELTTAEIVQAYGIAAANSAAAGFDGVELHAANGYLIDQFLNDGSNRRTDHYGGPLENRMRFLLEVITEIARYLPMERIGVRLSPSSDWMDAHDTDKRTLYSTVVRTLNGMGVAYLHLVEPEIAGSTTVDRPAGFIPTAEFAALFDGPVIVTGGHSQASAEQLLASGTADLVGFGRLFIANPDLPNRFLANAPLQPLRPAGIYGGGPEGYTDYPALAASGT
ncbi:alkene reductase [Arthrobacter sp. NQ4]|uniref:alkene reductase n=1 Tax=Arthrobacter sp. NQ4 TaxID=3027930 RepID=UPI0023AFA35B|nr:alkene reductase [Arthrobacter sp. NQ4]MDE8586064.1 alkene reductase [Arthrobacter sp. NQ4]